MDSLRSFIFAFGIMCFWGWYGCVRGTKNIIKEVGFHKKYYPKSYIIPNGRIRKLYNLKKKEIPKWTNYLFLLSFVYILLFLIGIPLVLLLEEKLFMMQLLYTIYWHILGGDIIYVVIFLFIYRKKRDK